jgi:hypothetical protein
MAEAQPAAAPGTPGKAGTMERVQAMLNQPESVEDEDTRKANMNERLAALETHFASRASQRGGGAQQAVVDAQASSYGTDSPVAKLASLQTRMQEDAAALPAAAPEPEVKESKKEMLENRLNALQQNMSKQQSSEAEKFKVLEMMLRRLQDEVVVEKIAQADIVERNTREIKILEHSLLLDVNVHKQARRDLDKIITKEIDEKCSVVRQELGEERQLRIAAAERSGIDPEILPSLSGKVEQEGKLRHDRGEQLMTKIDDSNINLHNMLAVEQQTHAKIEQFTNTVTDKCAELNTTINAEADARALMEDRHAQRVEQIRQLAGIVSSVRERRVAAVERITSKVSEELGTYSTYVQNEQSIRQDGEENILSMLENVTQKLQDEMKKERQARQSSEENFFNLLEDSCRRAVPGEQLGLPSTVEAKGLPALER